MLDARWIKLWRDIRATPGRTALMVLSMAAGAFGLATVLTSHAILEREMRRNYIATNPPSATLTLDRIDPALVAALRSFPGIKEAEAGSSVSTRIRTGTGKVLPMTVFLVGDFNAMRINTMQRDSGAWPPQPGTILLERDALGLSGTRVGAHLDVLMDDGTVRRVPVGGTLHDPALPPASSGQTIYAYAAPETLGAIGLDPTLRNLKLTVKERPFDIEAIESVAARAARWLAGQGYPVTRIKIPPPGEHPHQSLMSSMQGMMLVFATVVLVLGTVLAATMLSSLLASQRRQIGVMKAVGASTLQLCMLYLGLVGILALAATAIGTVLGALAGRAWAGVVLIRILNFTMESGQVPAWNYVALALTGVLLPILMAIPPILRSTRTTIRAAIDDNGCSAPDGATRSWLTGRLGSDRSFALALRNSLRRRARLVFVLALLACGGASFVATLNLQKAARQHLVDAARERLHDLELILANPADRDRVKRILAAVPGVARVESWRLATAGMARPDNLQIERIYPDGVHGALTIAAPEDDSAMIRLAMLAGTWLAPGEAGTAVLNQSALPFFPGVKVGDTVQMASRGKRLNLRIVGIARQHMSGATAYVTPRTFDALAGSPKSDTFRLVLAQDDDASMAGAARAVESALLAATIRPRLTVTETMMRKDVDGHFDLLLAALLFVAILMGLVAVIALGSAMGSNVAERTREIGVMRAIGATPGKVRRIILCEGVAAGLMSVPLAVALSLPLSLGLGHFLGEMLFGLGFPLAVSLPAIAGWSGLAFAGSLAATGAPAYRATRLSVHQAISTV